MSLAEETALRAREIRSRLMSPPNAVVDNGINLKRAKDLEPQQPKSVLEVEVIPIVEVYDYQPPVTPAKTITIPMIIKAVADYYLVGVKDIRGYNHSPIIAFPRQIAFYLALKLCRLSLGQVGLAFKRHHTTIMYGRNRVASMLRVNDDVEIALRTIESNLSGCDYD